MDDTTKDIDLAREGDRDALGRLLSRQTRRLEELARRQLRGVLAERVRTSDLVQSAYLQVIRRIATFRGSTEDEFAVWMIRVLENRVKESRRFHSALKRSPSDVPPKAETSTTPSMSACRIEDLKVLAEALDSLPEAHRQVITLRLGDNLSHEEIAAQIGRTVPATRMLLSRARAALALELEARESE